MGPSRFGELDTCRVGGVERWRFELAGLVFFIYEKSVFSNIAFYGRKGVICNFACRKFGIYFLDFIVLIYLNLS